MSATTAKPFSRYFPYLLIAAAAIFAFAPALSNGFTGWDDTDYVFGRNELHALNGENLRTIFSNPVLGNYVPLTMFSLAIDYALGGESASMYILHNIFLHLVCCLLVYCFARLLIDQKNTALFAALLFAVHPLHVESVAWIAERKDVLSGVWFFAALIAYVLYRKKSSWKWYGSAVIMLVLSLLAKPAAVAFLPILVIVDVLQARSYRNLSAWLDKIPFLIITIFFTVLGMRYASQDGQLMSSYALSVSERVAVASYAFVMYLVKFFVPFNLSAYYPYPFAPGEAMPGWLWAFPVIVLLLIVGVFALRKKYPVVFFGFFFFSFAIVPALQLFPVGDAVMADRFVYVGLFGLALALTERLSVLSRTQSSKLLPVLPGVLLIVIAVVSQLRCAVWANGKTLWKDVTEKYDQVSVAHNNLGAIASSEGNPEEAQRQFTRAIETNPKNRMAYFNRAAFYLQTKKYAPANDDFSKAAKFPLSQKDPDLWMGLGICRHELGLYAASVRAFDSCLIYRKDDATALWRRGLSKYLLRDLNGAAADYDRSLVLDPKNSDVLAKRGVLHFDRGDTTAACSDWNKAAALGNTAVTPILQQYCK